MGDTPPPRHREITPPPRHRDITPPPRHRDRYSSSPSPRERERERLPERSRSRSPVRRGKPINDGLDRSRSRTPPRRSRRGEPDALNPGNNLYVTGLSTRVNEKDLLEHFSQEGKVLECRLVLDPRTRESRGFGFVTMEHLEDAERCIKYLNRSTLEGRIITVEKAKRKRARTPTPGEYLGVRAMQASRRGGGGGRGGGSYGRDSRNMRHSPEYAPYQGGGRDRDRDRGRSPRYSPYRTHGGNRSVSPQYGSYRR
nr:serine/arginine-rich splicing factor SR45a-like isoform X2 [Physcomitrium patens]|eukprot:XP_024359303.1 serine/arginine-rich splicing factor SR45a-like isoform X2 [Physcomitrella patens]